MATIMSNTINITYNGTTRPVSYVWNPFIAFNHDEMNRHYWALTLYSFKDMIPDYQEYLQMSVYIDYRTQRNATFKLPVLNYNYTVETIGHGEVKGVYYNKHYTGYCPIWCILDQIEKELGIKRQLIKLIDHDGNEIKDNIVAEHPNLTVFAVFDSLESKMEEKGIEKELNYVSKFRAGDTLIVTKANKKDRLFDLKIIQFLESFFVIEKRTPKQVVVRDVISNKTYRKQIKTSRIFGEYVLIDGFAIEGFAIVMKESNIKIDTPYSVGEW
jgi:hypothetical protein